MMGNMFSQAQKRSSTYSRNGRQVQVTVLAVHQHVLGSLYMMQFYGH